MKKILFFTFLLIGVSFMQSCKKDKTSGENIITNDDVSSVIETERLTDDFFGLIDTNSFENTQNREFTKSLTLPNCATTSIVFHSPTHVTITITFDSNGCEMPNGNTYSGTLIIDRNFNTIEKKYTGYINFKDFYVNGIGIDGEASFEKMLSNQAGLPESDYEYDFTYTFPNGDIAKREGNKIRVWVEGFKTPSPSDNVFLIDGEAHILKRNGVEIDVEVIVPLKKIHTCPFYVSGIIQIKKEKKEAVLDFGDGSCDNEATLIFPNGSTQTITLKP